MEKDKLIDIIKEELLKHKVYKTYGFKSNIAHDLYKNPKSIRRFPPHSRAISTPNLDFYVLDEPLDDGGATTLIHADILAYLRTHEGYSLSETAMYIKPITESVIGWVRKDLKNEFYLSESYDWETQVEPYLDYLDEHIAALEKKFSNMKFIPDKI